jgi:hypothetical protein
VGQLGCESIVMKEGRQGKYTQARSGGNFGGNRGMHVHSKTAHTVNKNGITRFEWSSAASEGIVSRKSGASSSKNERSVTSLPPELEKWRISLSTFRKNKEGG